MLVSLYLCLCVQGKKHQDNVRMFFDDLLKEQQDKARAQMQVMMAKGVMLPPMLANGLPAGALYVL
jgi:hypothetical protein